MSGDFSWSDADERGSTVIPSVSAVAVYENPEGDIVIRQHGEMGEDDEVVIVPRKYARAIAKAINAIARTKFEPTFDPKSKA